MLRIKNLVKRYGQQTVLNIPDFLFETGISYAVTGPNGAGKSTLLMCLSGLLQPDSGQVTFKSDSAAQSREPTAGIVLQRPVLFSGTVLENVAYGLKCRGLRRYERNKQARRALESAGLAHLATKTRKQLSGGELQRIALLRTMILEPEVLLLDEPFTHLDPEASAELIRDLHAIQNRNVTIILTTHDLFRGYALCDRVISLNGGSIVPSQVLNVFRGVNCVKSTRSVLKTSGGMEITNAFRKTGVVSVFIDPAAVTLSRSQPRWTDENISKGIITSLSRNDDSVRVELDVGEMLVAKITSESCRDLNLRIDDEVWVFFGVSAIKEVEI